MPGPHDLAVHCAYALDARDVLGFVRELATARPDHAIVVVLPKPSDADTVVELKRLDVALLPHPCATEAAHEVVAPNLGRIAVDDARGLLTIGERQIRLTPRLFKLFNYLMASSGQPVRAVELARNVLERTDCSAPEAVRGAIRELRVALRGTSVSVETSRGYGYLLGHASSRNTHVRR